VRALPCTSVERTVVDLIPGCKSESAALAITLDAAGGRLTTRARLADRVGACQRLRFRVLLLAALDDSLEGVHSLLELGHAKACRRHGLPEPVRQARCALGGRVIRIDVVSVDYDLPTELDGLAWHADALTRWRDTSRDNAQVLQGRAAPHYGWQHVFETPCVMVQETAAALRQRGWTGTPYRCSPSCPVLDPVAGTAIVV
jgi:hypothetical protein